MTDNMSTGGILGAFGTFPPEHKVVAIASSVRGGKEHVCNKPKSTAKTWNADDQGEQNEMFLSTKSC